MCRWVWGLFASAGFAVAAQCDDVVVVPDEPPVAVKSEAATLQSSVFEAPKIEAAKKVEAPKKEPEKPKYPTAQVGGVVHLDSGWFSQSPVNQAAFGDILDGTSFRTARIWVKGELAEATGYQIEMDFGDVASLTPGRPNFQNVYVERSKIPYLGTVRIGRWKQPFNLETTATSIRFLTFIERASTFTFAPFRRTGVGLFDYSEDEKWTWAASAFHSGDDGYGDFTGDANGWATAERLSHLLFYECEGERLLHVGVAHTWNAAVNNQVRFRRFPEFAVGSTPVGGTPVITPTFFDTGVISADGYNVLGAEIAWVYGPASIQAEWMYAAVDRIAAANVSFDSWYVFATWFLTGEHRNYNRQQGGFDRLKPHRNFGPGENGCGSGAWELAARYSVFDANSKDVARGVLRDLTLGVNWYWNPNTKVQFNYIHAMPDAPGFGASTADIFAIRMAYDF